MIFIFQKLIDDSSNNSKKSPNIYLKNYKST